MFYLLCPFPSPPPPPPFFFCFFHFFFFFFFLFFFIFFFFFKPPPPLRCGYLYPSKDGGWWLVPSASGFIRVILRDQKPRGCLWLDPQSEIAARHNGFLALCLWPSSLLLNFPLLHARPLQEVQALLWGMQLPSHKRESGLAGYAVWQGGSLKPRVVVYTSCDIGQWLINMLCFWFLIPDSCFCCCFVLELVGFCCCCCCFVLFLFCFLGKGWMYLIKYRSSKTQL